MKSNLAGMKKPHRPSASGFFGGNLSHNRGTWQLTNKAMTKQAPKTVGTANPTKLNNNPTTIPAEIETFLHAYTTGQYDKQKVIGTQ